MPAADGHHVLRPRWFVLASAFEAFYFVVLVALVFVDDDVGTNSLANRGFPRGFVEVRTVAGVGAEDSVDTGEEVLLEPFG